MSFLPRFSQPRTLLTLGVVLAFGLLVAACSDASLTDPAPAASTSDVATSQVELSQVVDQLNGMRHEILPALQSLTNETTLLSQGALQLGTAYCLDPGCVEECEESPGCDPRVILEGNSILESYGIDADWQGNRLVQNGAVPGDIADALQNPDAFTFEVGPDGESIHLVNEVFLDYTADVNAQLDATAQDWAPGLQDAIQGVDGYEGTLVANVDFIVGYPRSIDLAGNPSHIPNPNDPNSPCLQPNPPPECALMQAAEMTFANVGFPVGVMTIDVVDQSSLSGDQIDQVWSGAGASVDYADELGWCGTPPQGNFGFPEIFPDQF